MAEWAVRSVICEALPNIAGLINTLVPAIVVQPYDIALASEERGGDAGVGAVFIQEHRKQVEHRFQVGMRQALLYSGRENTCEKEMRSITLEVLEGLVDDESSNTRRAAICMFAKVATAGSRHSVSTVLKACTDESRLVRAAAFSCLPIIVHRQRDPAEETVATKFEKKTTIEWVVKELVALMDPEKALNLNPDAPWKGVMTPEFKHELRQHALKALVGAGDEVVPASSFARGIVAKAHMPVIEGFTDHIYKGSPEVQEAILHMMPSISDAASDKHAHAIAAVVKCLTSPTDAIRHTAALILPRMVNIKNDVTIGQLVTLLGAGQEVSAVGASATLLDAAGAPNSVASKSASKRSAIAVLQSLSGGGGLSDEALKSQKGLLHDIAFGLNSGAHEYHKYDEESIMEPMLDIEAKTLQSYPSTVYVAKGLGCRLNAGVSGFDASHWKRRLFLLTAEGSLFLTPARGTEEPSNVFRDHSNFVAKRVSFGAIVPHAVKIEVVGQVTNDALEGKEAPTKESVILGFFTKDEATVWFRDFQNICKRNVKRAAQQDSSRARCTQILLHVEPDYVGRTAKALHEFVDQFMHPVTVETADFEHKQRKVQVKLSQLLNDKNSFVEFGGADDKKHKGKDTKHDPMGRRMAIANAETEKQAVANTQLYKTQKGLSAPLDEASQKHLQIKLDMTTFLNLLRHHELYGEVGFTQQAVSRAWKVANASDGTDHNVSTDKDKLKLDWHEYQTCIRLLAYKAGVTLEIDAQLLVFSYLYVPTYPHTRLHTYTHTHTHICTHTHTQICTHIPHIHPRTHTHRHTHTHIHTHTQTSTEEEHASTEAAGVILSAHTQRHTYTHTNTQTNIRTQSNTHTLTFSRTHILTHTQTLRSRQLRRMRKQRHSE